MKINKIVSIMMSEKSNFRSHYLFRLTLLFLFIIGSKVSGQVTQTGAIEDNPLGGGGGQRSIWAVPAEQKVRPDDRVENYNLIWMSQEKRIKVAGAGNEHVPFQVVITSPVPENRGPAADGFFIEASDLSSGPNNVISKEGIKFFLEHYIMLDAPSSSVGETGYWPNVIKLA